MNENISWPMSQKWNNLNYIKLNDVVEFPHTN